MSIDRYCEGILYFYIGLMLLSLCTGIVGIRYKIRKKSFKYWWIIPYSLLYLVTAWMLTAVAYIAYDDPADPNYIHYKDWELRDFILNDIKKLIIWLIIGALLFLIFKKGTKEINLALHCIIGVLAVMAVLVIILGSVGVAIS